MFPELMVSLFSWVLNCHNGPAARMRSVSISRSCFFKHGPLCLVLKRVCADAHTFAKNANVWSTPGRYTADVNYRYVFSRARRGPPAPALRFAIGRATRGAAEAVPFPFVLEHRCRMRQDGAKPRHHTSFPRTKTREGLLPPASLLEYSFCLNPRLITPSPDPASSLRPSGSPRYWRHLPGCLACHISRPFRSSSCGWQS